MGVGTATIFWVEADKLLSVQSGGNIRSYNILRQLAAQHEITFFSYYDRERDVRYERALQVEFPNAVCLCIFSSAGVRRRLHHWYSDRPFDTESRCRYERAAAQHAARFDWSVVGEIFSQVLDATAGLASGEKQACAFVPEG